MNSFQLNTIEEAVEEIKNGKMVIVVDDEDRENEGDFLTAARNVTTEMVNFMATEGRGLICVPLTEERCDELNLDLMVGKNTAQFETPFTVEGSIIVCCGTFIFGDDGPKTAILEGQKICFICPNFAKFKT